MKNSLRFGTVVAVLSGFLTLTSPAVADTLYTQSYDASGNANASQNDTTPGGYGAYATTYDNFTLGSAATVTNVAWTGQYFNPATQSPITSFTIDFYSDAAGTPGTMLYTTTIAGNGNETVLDASEAIFTYNDTVDFAVAAGTEYWMSIVANLDFPPQWGWSDGTGGDGEAYQCFEGECGPTDPASDQAFTLSGSATSPVPEPGTLVLLGTGLVGLSGVARRRFFRS